MAESTVLCGECSPIMLSVEKPGYSPIKSTGIMAKYFATPFAIENVVKLPLVIKNCLPMWTISISFVGEESKSTVLPASFAACVPLIVVALLKRLIQLFQFHQYNTCTWLVILWWTHFFLLCHFLFSPLPLNKRKGHSSSRSSENKHPFGFSLCY